MKSKDSKNNESGNDSTNKWIITVSLLSFTLSIIFSFIASITVNNLPIPIAIIVLLLVISIGILFDMIAMAVTFAEEKNFHAKASRKINGAKTSIKLIRNAPKVSSICADVIGDVCGILSGSVGTIVSIKIAQHYDLNFDLQIVIGALVAALTIGGKAKFKLVAQTYSTQIVDAFTKVLHIFVPIKKDKTIDKNKEKNNIEE